MHQCGLAYLTATRPDKSRPPSEVSTPELVVVRRTKVSGWEIAEHGTRPEHQRSEAAT
jgi:hypothetical protein